MAAGCGRTEAASLLTLIEWQRQRIERELHRLDDDREQPPLEIDGRREVWTSRAKRFPTAFRGQQQRVGGLGVNPN